MFDPSLSIDLAALTGIALQAAFVIGCTAVIGKFIKDPEDRDNVLPLVALVLGITAVAVADYEAGKLAFTSIFQGVALGGSATGLYAVVTGDGRDRVPVTDANTGN